jgi:lipopolysaccharide/colanic/teichoic acid biosynthesis glycosyltransferase
MIRFFDLLLAFAAILLLSPVLLFCAIILRFSGEGEVFYSQTRIGLRQKNFQLIKFVTMLKDSPNIGTGTITVQNDPRVLPFGKLLRKTKINELPQLLNILKGDMSLVGPRPMTRELFDIYLDKEKEIISSVKPGLSGYGSLFFRDEQKFLSGMSIFASKEFYSKYIQPYKAELEIYFVQKRSTYNYFLVIFLTILCVIFPNAVSVLKILNLPKPPVELLE